MVEAAPAVMRIVQKVGCGPLLAYRCLCFLDLTWQALGLLFFALQRQMRSERIYSWCASAQVDRAKGRDKDWVCSKMKELSAAFGTKVHAALSPSAGADASAVSIVPWTATCGPLSFCCCALRFVPSPECVPVAQNLENCCPEIWVH